MKVIMLVSTNYGGSFRKKDTEQEVPDVIGKRWIRNKLADYVGAPPAEDKEGGEVDESVSDVCDTDGPSGVPGDNGSEPTDGEPEAPAKGERASKASNSRSNRRK